MAVGQEPCVLHAVGTPHSRNKPQIFHSMLKFAIDIAPKIMAKKKAPKKIADSNKKSKKAHAKAEAVTRALQFQGPSERDMLILQASLEAASEQSPSLAFLAEDLMLRGEKIRKSLNDPAASLGKLVAKDATQHSVGREIRRQVELAGPDKADKIGTSMIKACVDRKPHRDPEWGSRKLIKSHARIATALDGCKLMGKQFIHEISQSFNDDSWMASHAPDKHAKAICRMPFMDLFAHPADAQELRLCALINLGHNREKDYDLCVNAYLDALERDGLDIPDKIPPRCGFSPGDDKWEALVAHHLSALHETTIARLGAALIKSGCKPTESYVNRCIDWSCRKPLIKKSAAALKAMPNAFEWRNGDGYAIAYLINQRALTQMRHENEENSEAMGKLFCLLCDDGMNPVDLHCAKPIADQAANLAIRSRLEMIELRALARESLDRSMGRNRL